MRAFLAVHPGEDVRSRIAAIQQELKDGLARVAGQRTRLTWVRPDVIHLTVKFLGEIEDDLTAPLRDALTHAARDLARVEVPLTRLGAFPRPQAPRVLWIGPTADWEQTDDGRRLADAVRHIEDICVRLGMARDEQRWHPHLTLARVRTGEARIGGGLVASGLADRTLTAGSLRLDTLMLMKSTMKPDGPVHTGIWSLP
jgi:2'-5' RNA ligase